MLQALPGRPQGQGWAPPEGKGHREPFSDPGSLGTRLWLTEYTWEAVGRSYSLGSEGLAWPLQVLAPPPVS